MGLFSRRRVSRKVYRGYRWITVSGVMLLVCKHSYKYMF